MLGAMKEEEEEDLEREEAEEEPGAEESPVGVVWGFGAFELRRGVAGGGKHWGERFGGDERDLGEGRSE